MLPLVAYCSFPTYIGFFALGCYIGKNKVYLQKIKEIMNPLVLGAYVCFFGASLLTVLAYRGVDLSWGPVLETTSYIYIMILSAIFLHEKVSKRKVLGNIIIILGIIIYAFGDKL